MKKSVNYLFFLFLFAFIIPKVVFALDGKVKIENSFYSSIEEAIANSKEGDTITLVDDLDLTDKRSEVYKFLENTTLDLNGHTISVRNMSVIYTGIGLTICNGTFSTTKNNSYALFIGDMVDTDQVLVENITTEGGINIFNATNVVLRNVNSLGHDFYSVWADEHALVTIESGTYQTEGNYVFGIAEEESSYIHVEGGNFITTNDNLVLGNPKDKLIFYGGNFDTDPSDYAALNAKVNVVEDGTYVVGFERNIEVPFYQRPDDKNKVILALERAENLKDQIYHIIDSDKIKHKNVVVKFSVNDTEASDDLKKEFMSVLGDLVNINFLSYFTISSEAVDIDSNLVIEQISKLNDEIVFRINIPENLRKDGTEKEYYILQKINGKVTVVPVEISADSETLTFKTDELSDIVFAYREITYETKYQIPVYQEPDDKNNAVLGLDEIEKTKKILQTSVNINNVIKRNVLYDISIKSSKLDERLKEEFLSIFEESANINFLNYFTVSSQVVDIDSNLVIEKISKVNDKITFRINIPEKLLKDSVEKEYYILQKINGKVSIIPIEISADSETLTFKTDELSDIAFAYREVTYETKYQIPVYQEPEDKNNVVLGMNNVEEIKKILFESVDADIRKKRNILIDISIKEVDVSEDEKDEFVNFASDFGKLEFLSFFDITIPVIDVDTKKELYTITKLNDKISFRINIPERLRVDGLKREYYILRKHENKINMLPVTVSSSGDALMFESDEFSYYVLAYKEVKENNSELPDMSDNLGNKGDNNGITNNPSINNPQTYDTIYKIRNTFILGFLGLIVTFIFAYKQRGVLM